MFRETFYLSFLQFDDFLTKNKIKKIDKFFWHDLKHQKKVQNSHQFDDIFLTNSVFFFRLKIHVESLKGMATDFWHPW